LNIKDRITRALDDVAAARQELKEAIAARGPAPDLDTTTGLPDVTIAQLQSMQDQLEQLYGQLWTLRKEFST